MYSTPGNTTNNNDYGEDVKQGNKTEEESKDGFSNPAYEQENEFFTEIDISLSNESASPAPAEEDIQSPFSQLSEMQSTGLLKNLKFLVKNPSFHLLIQVYTLYLGLFSAGTTLLNQICTRVFQGKEWLIGIMGFTLILLGALAIFIGKSFVKDILLVGHNCDLW